MAEYGAAIIKDLRKARRRIDQFAHPEVVQAIDRAVKFLRTRLTDAAKAGCHHCDEGEKDAPCWWCGLKTHKGKL